MDHEVNILTYKCINCGKSITTIVDEEIKVCKGAPDNTVDALNLMTPIREYATCLN